jgi:hypothetical protein
MPLKSFFFKYLFLFVIVILSCHNDDNHKEILQFYFTYVKNSEAFSLCFTGTDTIILKTYWSDKSLSDNSKTYISIVGDAEKKKFSNLINDINISELDTLYPEYSPVDGVFIGLNLKKEASTVTVYPQSQNVPEELSSLISYITDARKRLNFTPADIHVDFKSAPRKPDNINKTEKFDGDMM